MLIKKYSYVFLFCIFSYCIFVQDAKSDGLPNVTFANNKNMMAILKDKSGNLYEVIDQSYLKNGMSYLGYAIAETNSESNLHLGGGFADPFSEGCPSPSRRDFLTKEMGWNKESLENGISNLTIRFEDINKDKAIDIIVKYQEEDCRRNVKKDILNVFTATEKGFVKSENH